MHEKDDNGQSSSCIGNKRRQCQKAVKASYAVLSVGDLVHVILLWTNTSLHLPLNLILNLLHASITLAPLCHTYTLSYINQRLTKQPINSA